MEKDPIEEMQKLVNDFGYRVLVHSKLRTRESRESNAARIEHLINRAAANGMELEDLQELAEVEW
jgi:hypothetical protein